MLVRVENISSFIKWFPASAFFISLQIFFYIILQLPITPHDMIIESMAGINLYIGKGEYWRLLTPIFLHTNIFHLLLNSLSIFIFGPFAEKALGKLKFVLCFLVCGIFRKCRHLSNHARLLLPCGLKRCRFWIDRHLFSSRFYTKEYYFVSIERDHNHSDNHRTCHHNFSIPH